MSRPHQRTIPAGVTLDQQVENLVQREQELASKIGGIVRVARGPAHPAVDRSVVVLLDEEAFACVAVKDRRIYVKGFGRHPQA